MNPPREIGRTALLCLVGGSADAIAYLRFGTFVGAMTGNTVLLGIAITGGHFDAAIYHVAIIAVFLIAAIVTASVLGGKTPVIVPLALTAIMLGVSGLILSRWGAALSAAALGMQSATVRRIAGVPLNTAFITGDLIRLGVAVSQSDAPQQHHAVVLLATAWIAYAVGAVVGAVVLHLISYPMIVPAVLALAAAVLETLAGRRNAAPD